MRDYELKAFFAYVIEVLERLEIPYMVVGGFAAIFYGEPRLTIDVDIVVDMGWKHITPLVAAFPIPDYYVSEVGSAPLFSNRLQFEAKRFISGFTVPTVSFPFLPPPLPV